MVKWKEYNKPTDNTWEPASNLGKSIIDAFEKKILESSNKQSSSINIKKESSLKETVKPPPLKSVKKAKSKKQEVEEYIIEMLVKRDGNRYLVKWENFPVGQNTWEPRSSIPNFLLEVRLRFKNCKTLAAGPYCQNVPAKMFPKGFPKPKIKTKSVGQQHDVQTNLSLKFDSSTCFILALFIVYNL